MRKPFSPLDLLAVVERARGSGARHSRTRHRARRVRRGGGAALRPRPPASARGRARPADAAPGLLSRDGRRARDARSSRGTRDTHAHSHRVQRYAVELLATIDPERLIDDPGIRVRLPAARRRQDRDPGRDPAEAGAVDRRRAPPDADAHGARRADARRRRVPPGRGAARSCARITSAGTARAIRTALAGDGHSARGARVRGRRLARRDDERPPVPQRAAAGRVRATRSSRRPGSSSIRTSSRRSASAEAELHEVQRELSSPDAQAIGSPGSGFGTATCCQSVILPLRTTKSARLSCPGASQ